MEKFLSRSPVVHEYRGSRRLEASGSGRSAWLDVRAHFTVPSGLVYEVAAEGGSGYIRSRVLKSLLDEEQQLIARGGSAGVAISEANYQFTPEGVNGEGLAVVALKARRKDRSLMSGRIFLNAANGELVRLEGRLAKNPSFWLTRVDVVRTYRSIGGALMPVSLVTKGRLRLLGSSELRMIYRYSHIDEQPVPDEAVETASARPAGLLHARSRTRTPTAERNPAASNSQRSFSSKLAAASQASVAVPPPASSHAAISARAHQAFRARKRINHTTARFVSPAKSLQTTSSEGG
jgi:hypothetical protein